MERNEARKKAYKHSHEIALAIKAFTEFLDENGDHFECELHQNHFTHLELQHYGQRFFDMGEIYNKRDT